MNRRGFLGAVAATVAAPALAYAAAHKESDDYRYRGYRVIWRDWQQPVNQAIAFGVWYAIDGSGRFRYCTTMGSGLDHHAHELDVLDCMWMRGEWPSPWDMAHATQAQRDRVKAQARRALLQRL